MTTTTSYGNWHQKSRGGLTLRGDVADALLAGCDYNDYTDEQIDAVADAYRDAINAALPDSVSLCGDEFYGHAYEADCADQTNYPHDEYGTLDIPAIIDGVDFWDIVENVLAPVSAATLAELIAKQLGTTPGPLRDGAYSIDNSGTADAAGVWRLHVGDDPSADAPHGISWALDSPDERGVASGGWEHLPGHLAAAEAATLAGYLKGMVGAAG